MLESDDYDGMRHQSNEPDLPGQWRNRPAQEECTYDKINLVKRDPSSAWLDTHPTLEKALHRITQQCAEAQQRAEKRTIHCGIIHKRDARDKSRTCEALLQHAKQYSSDNSTDKTT